MAGTSVRGPSRARKVILAFTLAAAATWGLPATPTGAAPIVFSAAGANPAAIQAKVDEFRAALGGNDNGNGNSVFRTGRREVDWDDVPDGNASPNFLDPKYYNTTAPRGLVANAIELNGSSFNDLRVSADSSNPTTTPVEFGDIDSSYQATFQPFSAPRLMTVRGGHALELTFFIPGTNLPATVSGFGAVFSDVDIGTGARTAIVRGYDADGDQIVALAAQAASNGLSFSGFTFNAGERLARVVIIAGNADLATGVGDSATTDVIAMDDFIFGEPRAMEDHPADFDGDGGTDLSVFRPSEGRWYTKDSGTGTVQATSFGLTGDIPVAADYDGDGRTDLAVYRPSNGGWFIQRTTAGPISVFFGLAEDTPAPADYDKDGKADVAVYRPSVGGWFIQQSSNGSLRTEFFGLIGDIPVPRMP